MFNRFFFPPPSFSNVLPSIIMAWPDPLGRRPRCGRGLLQRRHRGLRQGHAVGEGAAIAMSASDMVIFHDG